MPLKLAHKPVQRNLSDDQAESLSKIQAGIDKAKREMVEISRQFQRGEINLTEWQIKMAATIKKINLGSVAIARGGFDKLTVKDLGRAGNAVKAQYQYLNRFAFDIEQGLSQAKIEARAAMYAEAARGTYTESDRAVNKEAGYTEERRVLNAAEHCSQCKELAAKSWQPIGTLPKLGSTICRVNCRCSWEYR